MRYYHCMNTNVHSDIQGQTLTEYVKDLKGMSEDGQAYMAICRVISLRGYEESLIFKKGCFKAWVKLIYPTHI